MANPFFSGRISQELYDRVDQHIKESGEGKTQILINALSQYLGIEISTSKSSTDLFLSELESLKERVSLLERSQSQQIIEPIKIAENPHKQMSLLDQVSDNDDNSIDNTVTVESTDNTKRILTTNEVVTLLGVGRKVLESLNKAGKLPFSKNGHTIICHSGKQAKHPFSNLWEVEADNG